MPCQSVALPGACLAAAVLLVAGPAPAALVINEILPDPGRQRRRP